MSATQSPLSGGGGVGSPFAGAAGGSVRASLTQQQAQPVQRFVVALGRLWCAVGNADIEVYEANGERVALLTGHRKIVKDLCVVSEGTSTPLTVWSASYDQTIRVWDAHTFECIATLVAHTAGVRCLSSGHGFVFSGSMDGTVAVWDNVTYSLIRTLQPHTRAVGALCVDSLGRFWTGSDDTTMRVIDSDGTRVAKPYGHSSYVTALLVANDRVFSASDDCSVRVWDERSFRPLKRLLAHTRAVTSLAFWPPYVFSGGVDGNVYCWHAETFERRDLPRTEYATSGVYALYAVDGLLYVMYGSRNIAVIDVHAAMPSHVRSVDVTDLEAGTTAVLDGSRTGTTRAMIAEPDTFGDSPTRALPVLGADEADDFQRMAQQQEAVAEAARRRREAAIRPRVEHVQVLPAHDGVVRGTVQYRGGKEGASRVQWEKISPSGDVEGVSNADEDPMVFRATFADIGWRVRFIYTPVRADGETGKAVASAWSNELRFEDVSTLMTGVAPPSPSEGQECRLEIVAPDDFDGSVLVQWYRDLGNSVFVPIQGAVSDRYVPTRDDVGLVLRAVATPVLYTNQPGRPSPVDTAPVVALPPRLESTQLVVVGYGGVGSLFSMKAVYSGGHPGTHKFVWLRAENKQVPYAPIDYADEQTYVASADDVDAYLACLWIPTRSDGVRGEPVGREVGPLSLPAVVTRIAERLERDGHAIFGVDVVAECTAHPLADDVRRDEADDVQNALLSSEYWGDPSGSAQAGANDDAAAAAAAAENGGGLAASAAAGDLFGTHQLLITRDGVRLQARDADRPVAQKWFNADTTVTLYPQTGCHRLVHVMLDTAAGCNFLLRARSRRDRDVLAVVLRRWQVAASKTPEYAARSVRCVRESTAYAQFQAEQRALLDANSFPVGALSLASARAVHAAAAASGPSDVDTSGEQQQRRLPGLTGNESVEEAAATVRDVRRTAGRLRRMRTQHVFHNPSLESAAADQSSSVLL